MPTQVGGFTKSTCWKLSRTPRTIGYQENPANTTSARLSSPYAVRFSPILRRNLAPPVPARPARGRSAGRTGARTLADLGEDTLHLRLRRAQQLPEIGVGLGEHRLHHRVQRGVDLL